MNNALLPMIDVFQVVGAIPAVLFMIFVCSCLVMAVVSAWNEMITMVVSSCGGGRLARPPV